MKIRPITDAPIDCLNDTNNNNNNHLTQPSKHCLINMVLTVNLLPKTSPHMQRPYQPPLNIPSCIQKIPLAWPKWPQP